MDDFLFPSCGSEVILSPDQASSISFDFPKCSAVHLVQFLQPGRSTPAAGKTFPTSIANRCLLVIIYNPHPARAKKMETFHLPSILFATGETSGNFPFLCPGRARQRGAASPKNSSLRVHFHITWCLWPDSNVDLSFCLS